MSRTSNQEPKLSFEFFPVGSSAQERSFWRTVGALETLDPAFFSITCGALGSARDVCSPVVQRLCQESTVPLVVHQTCLDQAPAVLESELRALRSLGARGVVALRGDRPDGHVEDTSGDTFVHADQLVDLVASVSDLEIYVACYPETHPEAVDAGKDLEVLRRKFESGAKAAVTQFFYDPECYLRFRDRAWDAGIEQPLIPGVLPIHDIEKIVRFSERCRASVPVGLVEEYRVWADDPEALRELSITHTLALLETLRQEGVDHFHFYTLNQSDLVLEIAHTLFDMSNSGRVSSAA